MIKQSLRFLFFAIGSSIAIKVYGYFISQSFGELFSLLLAAIFSVIIYKIFDIIFIDLPVRLGHIGPLGGF